MVGKVILASPRGFCAGVVRAVDIVRIALDTYGPPLYVRKEIVHNRHVVEDLSLKGAIFVDELTEVPEGQRVVFSAHGVSPEVHRQARSKSLDVIDATCPLVTKVHMEARRFAARDFTMILIGHEGHEEVEGTMGEAPSQMMLVASVEDVEALQVDNPERVAYLTQTTLSLNDTSAIIEALRRRFPNIQGPPSADICYATQNRQEAVQQLATQVDLVLVIGATNSSNSNRLVEEAVKAGTQSYLVADVSELQPGWLEGVETVGITSGASAPERLVAELVAYFTDAGARLEELVTRDEDVHFNLPRQLQKDAGHTPSTHPRG